MYEMSGGDVDHVAGGLTIGGFWTWLGVATSAYNAWSNTMQNVGGTLSNYYGRETTLDIINGGNLGA